jgi:hypothetical protein
MKLVLASSLIAAAAAFAPSSQKSKVSTSLNSYESELGVVAPTGFFGMLRLLFERRKAFRLSACLSNSSRCATPSDPLGLSNDIDQETFDAYRVSELKHGRVCMLGVIGYIVPEVFRFPGEIAPGLAFADVPNGVAAIDAIPSLGWAQMFFLIGATDYYGFLGNFEAGMKPVGKSDIDELQLNELQNGRLAMLAFLELLRHDSQNLVSPGFDGLDNLITGLPFLYE